EAAIHDARRAIKKSRAILDVIEEDGGRGLGKDRKRLRKSARMLSPFRDADARVEVFDRLRRRAPSVRPEHTLALVRRQLLEDRTWLVRDAKLEKTLKRVARTLRKSKRRVGRWRPAHRKFQVMAIALRAARAESRKAMARAKKRAAAGDFHEWRKTVKTL